MINLHAGRGRASTNSGKLLFTFLYLLQYLVFVNWGKPDTTEGFWHSIFANKWFITGVFGLAFAFINGLYN